MNHNRKKSRELSISSLWPPSSKNSRDTRSLSRDDSKPYKHTLSFPLKEHNQLSSFSFQPQTTAHKGHHGHDLQSTQIHIEQPFFKNDRNPTKHYICQKITEIVENQILPFFTQKLASL